MYTCNIYIYIYMHICILSFICSFVCVSIYMFVYLCIYLSIDLSIRPSIYLSMICVHMFMHMYMCLCIHRYVQVHMYMCRLIIWLHRPGMRFPHVQQHTESLQRAFVGSQLGPPRCRHPHGAVAGLGNLVELCLMDGSGVLQSACRSIRALGRPVGRQLSRWGLCTLPLLEPLAKIPKPHSTLNDPS